MRRNIDWLNKIYKSNLEKDRQFENKPLSIYYMGFCQEWLELRQSLLLSNKEDALEEFIDCLHFYLSLYSYYGFDGKFILKKLPKYKDIYNKVIHNDFHFLPWMEMILVEFREIFVIDETWKTWKVKKKTNPKKVINSLNVLLMSMIESMKNVLHITDKDIYNSYFKKSETNIKRWKTNY